MPNSTNDTTDLTKLIIPPVFNQWVIDHLDDTNNLLKSGILTSNVKGIGDLNAPGVDVQIPYFKAKKVLPGMWTDQDDKTSNSVGTGSMRGMKFYQTLTYSATQLATLISGAPTAEAIASAMLEDWTAADMDALLKLLKGVFGVEDIQSAKSIDMTSVSPTNADFNSTGWLAARTLMGDKANNLTGIAVNSATEAMMTQEDLKDHGSEVSSEVAPNGTFHGMIITVDDQIPLDLSDPKKPKSTAYIFSQGSVAYKRQIIQTDTQKDILKKGGMSWVSQDSIGTMNVQGTTLAKNFRPAKYPYATVDELTSPNAWEIPDGRSVRDIGVVQYVHTVDPLFAKGIIAAQKKAQDTNDAKTNQDTQDPNKKA
ncbi:hypothetical protein [Lactobacillus intestinalis]|uniref:hypothetical protein n=1 Tax=Lactobacillus intestinalis TaxID=151781 RepID=UPI00272BB7A1|nr:hypothetical protein [Lactobacillus intestinalis]